MVGTEPPGCRGSIVTLFNPATFAQRLLRLRTEKGWSQRDLADASGLSGAIVGYYEKQERVPTVSSAMQLAHALGVSLQEMCEPEGE